MTVIKAAQPLNRRESHTREGGVAKVTIDIETRDSTCR